ncbi:MAG: phosphatidylglycerol lysyltransferase domain-containing protein [Bacteroidales bacterium]|jgi:hypothetical protein|nr:phosphatidylglycerol lysyltransferase domain-containing protein [Bacteroidales bacterium]MCI2144947.1 phosphatidylglycerol lysyltransferase domain-containing protein [Bacteroidales bacterium]
MLEFRQIELGDKEWIDPLLAASDFQGTEYSFSTMWMWTKIFDTEISRFEDYLIVRSIENGWADYVYPAGKGNDDDFRRTLLESMDDARRLKLNFSIVPMLKSKQEYIEGMFPGQFKFEDIRDAYDYIYLTDDLINLSGKKYQAKRNHIHHFETLPDWQYETMTPENLGDCIKMTFEWCKRNGCKEDVSLNSEICAVQRALHNMEALKLKGGLLRVQGKVVAYSVGEKLNSDTFIVHIEKAFDDVDGAYPMINREFLKHEATGCVYVNREDDSGKEGLRTAKLSYHPVYLLEKCLGKLIFF